MPRLLPLVGVAIGGVLAVKALTEAPQLWLGAQALAEDVAHAGKTAPPVPPNASILSNPQAAATDGQPKAAPACAPTAAELAREAGLSPAELQVLQSLSDRRGQLDQREAGLDTQVQLIAAAEAKLDARIGQMNQLKGDIQALLNQADQQAQAEQDRLVRVYEDMPPKAAAAALTVMDDSVRLPIAAKMKERKLADILRYMLPADAKALTEKLAQRTAGSQAITDAKNVLNPNAQTQQQAAAPKAPPAQPQANQGQNAQSNQAQSNQTQSNQAQSNQGDQANKTGKRGKTGRGSRTARAKGRTAPAANAQTQAQTQTQAPTAQPAGKGPKAGQNQANQAAPAQPPAKAG